MNIEVRDTITLCNNREYVISGIAKYQDNTYYYLVSLKDNIDIKFCMNNKNNVTSLIEITDSELIQRLLPLFYNSVESFIPDDLKN